MGTRKNITLDWTKTKRIEASGYSILSALNDIAQEAGTFIEHLSISKTLKHPIFNAEIASIRPAASSHCHETASSLNMCIDGGFSPVFSMRFAEKFHTLDSKQIFHGQLVINELLQNATDHSGSERYYMFAEIQNNQLLIGMLDSGVGIPAKMSQKYFLPNDEEFIDFSFKEGISTRRLRQGGYGLFHTFNIVKNNEGNLVVLSHDGGIRRYFAQRKVVRLKLKNTLRGTWCFLDMKMENKK